MQPTTKIRQDDTFKLKEPKPYVYPNGHRNGDVVAGLMVTGVRPFEVTAYTAADKTLSTYPISRKKFLEQLASGDIIPDTSPEFAV